MECWSVEVAYPSNNSIFQLIFVGILTQRRFGLLKYHSLKYLEVSVTSLVFAIRTGVTGHRMATMCCAKIIMFLKNVMATLFDILYTDC
jgi:hypothetical protein